MVAAPSQRQLRVGELIRRVLADVLACDNIHDPDLSGVSVTVGEVRTSPDLRRACVHVTPLGGGNSEAVIAALNRNAGSLRHTLNKVMTLKHSPKLTFVYDTTFDQIEETRRLFAQPAVRRDTGGGDA